MKIVFATHNPHKAREIQEMLDGQHQIVSLADLQLHDDIPEPYDTLEANAQGKALYVWQRFGLPVFADDTGLEVDALGGAPGVYSARYAGPDKDPLANMQLLLQQLHQVEDRSARFRTVIAYIDQGKTHYFEGKVEGRIAHTPRGDQGFGYDPVFEPEGLPQTFAQLSAQQKHAISHRGRAMGLLIDFLRQLDEPNTAH